MTAKTTRKTGGRSRRTKGAGGIIHRADGRWEFRREIGRDPATGKRRFIAASGRTKADARERFGAKVAEMERTGLVQVKNPWFALRVQVNPPSVVVEDEGMLPARFKQTITTVKVLKAEIGNALKAGEAVFGAHLERTTRLVIQ